MNDVDQPRTVKGHYCRGLDRHFAASEESNCVPWFNEEGYIVGCDNTNYTAIVYCPYCGEHLD